ncbi:unnamed protein product, partial [Rotaria magnacalcarata]
FQGYKLDESIGIDIEQFTDKTRHLAKIYKRKTIEEPSTSNEYTEKKSS